MSRYVVKVTCPDGMPRYANRNRLAARLELATRYPHQSNAQEAAERMRRRIPRGLNPQIEIVDTRRVVQRQRK
mgnify:FL=1